MALIIVITVLTCVFLFCTALEFQKVDSALALKDRRWSPVGVFLLCLGVATAVTAAVGWSTDQGRARKISRLPTGQVMEVVSAFRLNGTAYAVLRIWAGDDDPVMYRLHESISEDTECVRFREIETDTGEKTLADLLVCPSALEIPEERLRSDGHH